jgi:TolB-like protein
MACLLTPQAAGPKRQVPETSLSASAGADESEIIVQRGPDDKKEEFLNVFIDGVLSAEVLANSTAKLILPNGPHSISVGIAGKMSSTQKFQAKSSRLVFKASLSPVAFAPLILKKESDVSLDPAAAAAQALLYASGADSLAQAIALVAKAIADDLPEKSRIGIINIKTPSADDGEFAVDELTAQFVKMKKFSVVERHSLDVVFEEQDLQMSGVVDDDSAIFVGRLAGAEIVLTGSISGSGDNRRLTVKALHVQSGEIQAMSSQKF